MLVESTNLNVRKTGTEEEKYALSQSQGSQYICLLADYSEEPSLIFIASVFLSSLFSQLRSNIMIK